VDRRALAAVGAALLAHQLRDATRRGFWLWPLGSAWLLSLGSGASSGWPGKTAPLPRVAYFCALLAVPLVARLVARSSRSPSPARLPAADEQAIL
jgi:hypothetical protein